MAWLGVKLSDLRSSQVLLFDVGSSCLTSSGVRWPGLEWSLVESSCVVTSCLMSACEGWSDVGYWSYSKWSDVGPSGVWLSLGGSF